MVSRVLVIIGWLLAAPGVVLGVGLAAQLFGVAEAAGCRPERFLAIRCPEGLLGSVATDLHDLGTIVLLAPQLAILPMLYTAFFIAARLAVALLREPAARSAR
jgi:hypothetical protein